MLNIGLFAGPARALRGPFRRLLSRTERQLLPGLRGDPMRRVYQRIL
jgi:hypothetical protein